MGGEKKREKITKRGPIGKVKAANPGLIALSSSVQAADAVMRALSCSVPNTQNISSQGEQNARLETQEVHEHGAVSPPFCQKKGVKRWKNNTE